MVKTKKKTKQLSKLELTKPVQVVIDINPKMYSNLIDWCSERGFTVEYYVKTCFEHHLADLGVINELF